MPRVGGGGRVATRPAQAIAEVPSRSGLPTDTGVYRWSVVLQDTGVYRWSGGSPAGRRAWPAHGGAMVGPQGCPTPQPAGEHWPLTALHEVDLEGLQSSRWPECTGQPTAVRRLGLLGARLRNLPGGSGCSRRGTWRAHKQPAQQLAGDRSQLTAVRRLGRKSAQLRSLPGSSGRSRCCSTRTLRASGPAACR